MIQFNIIFRPRLFEEYQYPFPFIDFALSVARRPFIPSPSLTRTFLLLASICYFLLASMNIFLYYFRPLLVLWFLLPDPCTVSTNNNNLLQHLYIAYLGFLHARFDYL